MNRKYFCCRFRLHGQDRYLICISDEPEDGVWLDSQGRIPVFGTEMQLAAYAREQQIYIEPEEPSFQDLDHIAHWLRHTDHAVECDVLFDAWNLFMEVAYSLDIPYIGSRVDRKIEKIYDKLFYGINIFRPSPEEEYYIPQWKEAERKLLSDIFQEGMYIFESHMAEVQA